MDLLFHYEQHKKDIKHNLPSYCEFRLYEYDNKLTFISTIDITYHRWGVKKNILYNYSFIINMENGDIDLISKIINDKYNETGKHTSKLSSKKNDFRLLSEIIESGLIRGERKLNYWGVKFNFAVEKLFHVFHDKLSPFFKTKFYQKKNYKEKYNNSSFYDLIVDFHLQQKNIKGHDNVYNDIKVIYPKNKWLKLNDNKFLPSVLDSLKIKSKYMIGELSQTEYNLNLLSVNYVCKLFGDNYIDYIKQIPWEMISCDEPINKKNHTLKNDSEKKFMIQLINNWQSDVIFKSDSFIHNINKLLSLREKLEKKGLNLKFKIDNDNVFEYTYEKWLGINSHLTNGYKMRYLFPKEFLEDVETPIVINDRTYSVKVLKSEEDFRIEGFIMKNCMGKQFPNGIIHQFITIEIDKKRINTQYKSGSMNRSYGKANTVVPDEFNEAIVFLNQKMGKYKDLQWSKEKYDFIK